METARQSDVQHSGMPPWAGAGDLHCIARSLRALPHSGAASEATVRACGCRRSHAGNRDTRLSCYR